MNLEKNWQKPNPHQEIEEGIAEYKQEKQEKEEKNNILENDDDLYIKERYNGNNFELKNVDKLSEKISEKIYDWYEEAMKRRNREPLSKESFISHFFWNNNFDQSICFGNDEKGYLLGSNKYGAFVPSHFAPKTIRGGYDLLAALGNSEQIPAILAVTEDLNDTLKKMPSWNTLEIDENFMTYFREELIKKKIMYNDHPAVQRVMQGLLIEFLNQN